MKSRLLCIGLLVLMGSLMVPSMGGCSDNIEDVLRDVSGDLDNLADDLDDDHDNHSFWDTLFGDDD